LVAAARQAVQADGQKTGGNLACEAPADCCLCSSLVAEPESIVVVDASVAAFPRYKIE
jgi:hypothetical protein